MTIPGPEQAKVEEAPPFNRWNFAYIEIPGPYEKNLPSVYYIAPPDPTWPKAEQQAYIPGKSMLLFTSAHEVWPGHFLQFLHANRADWKFGQLYVGYAFAEGWAHYMRGDDVRRRPRRRHAGDPHRPAQRSAAARRALPLGDRPAHRRHDRRAVGTDVPDKALQDPGNARQQAARGTYDPAYLNYTLGKLMIMQLREDWTTTHGGRAGWKAFHDQFLAYGGPPIPLVRAQMLGGKPEAKLWTLAGLGDRQRRPAATQPSQRRACNTDGRTGARANALTRQRRAAARLQLRPRRRLRQRCGHRAADQFGQHRLRRTRGRCGVDARRRYALCRDHGVAIGAHPSYEDREHFGRRELDVGPRRNPRAGATGRLARLADGLRWNSARACSTSSRMARCTTSLRATAAVADAIAAAMRDFDPSLILYGLSGSALDRSRDRDRPARRA